MNIRKIIKSINNTNKNLQKMNIMRMKKSMWIKNKIWIQMIKTLFFKGLELKKSNLKNLCMSCHHQEKILLILKNLLKKKLIKNHIIHSMKVSQKNWQKEKKIMTLNQKISKQKFQNSILKIKEKILSKKKLMKLLRNIHRRKNQNKNKISIPHKKKVFKIIWNIKWKFLRLSWSKKKL